MTLVVRGKTLIKTIEEVAALSEFSPDEVRADPARALKVAQKMMAADSYLDEARQRIARSDTPSQPGKDGAADRPARAAQHPERNDAGDDDRDQPGTTPRNTTGKVDFTKLVEAIQVEDPKEAGQKVKEIFETAADEAAEKKIAEREHRSIRQADTARAHTSMKEFVDEHPELNGNRYAASAIAAALVDEYRTDLVEALKAEGEDVAEAERIVSMASPDQVALAHKNRRLRGDAGVRQIDKQFFETAYSRVTESLGVKTRPTETAQPNGLQGRKDLKRALPHQPQRASVPPAQPAAPAKAPRRSDVVQEMRRARGQKP
jgi:hypothetical protein